MELKGASINQAIFFSIIALIASVGAEKFVADQRDKNQSRITKMMQSLIEYNEDLSDDWCNSSTPAVDIKPSFFADYDLADLPERMVQMRARMEALRDTKPGCG